MASERVTVGSKPGHDGHGDADGEQEAVGGGVPSNSAIAKNTTPTAIATAAMIRDTRSSSRRSGVGAGRCTG